MKSYKQHLVEMYVNIMDIGDEFTSLDVSHWIGEFHSYSVTTSEASWILSHMEDVEGRKLTRSQQTKYCTGARVMFRRIS